MTEVTTRPPVSVLSIDTRVPESPRRVSRRRRGAVCRRQETVAIFGMVVLAALLRLPTLTRAYWVDEGISVGVASHHLTQIPTLLRRDGSPPLFYVLLHFWLRA